ncbi:MAG: hypothetical protein J6X55_10845 [Victivallales bacterium]|nr:hypothetical protein [Victivallales bacterium]
MIGINKHWVMRLVFYMILCTLCINSLHGSQGVLENCLNLVLENGVLHVLTVEDPFKEIGFEADNDIWAREECLNYRNRLEMTIGKEYEGVPCLMVNGGKARKETDTAWVAKTRSIPYTGTAGDYVVDVYLAADYAFDASIDKLYTSAVVWFDADGNVISQTPLKVTATSRKFSQSRTKGRIPEKAVSYKVSVGFDAPNVDPGHFCAVSKVVLAKVAEKSNYHPVSSFEIPPQQLETSDISWKAECPEGTSIKLQISDAPDANGVPGEWALFHGPDGTANSFYEAPFKAMGPWTRLKVFFFSNKDQCPVLKEVNFNGIAMTQWELARSKLAPLVENLTVSPTLNRREDIVLRISCMNAISWPTFTATIDGKDATARFTRKGNLMVCPTSEDYADGLHEIKVSIADINGKSTTSTKYLMIGQNPSNVPHVTLRDDGMTLVDGKPFFPIGAYAIWKREFNNFDFDKAFKDLSEAGFNFAHSYNGGAEYPQFLDTAQKYGMRVWSAAYSIHSKDFLLNRLNHPAIIAWYIGDDTSANTTPCQLQDRHDALKAIDDHRITTQAEHVRSAAAVSLYRDYVRGTDNYLPEVYPATVDTAENRGSTVAEVIRDMKTIMSDIDKCGIEHPKSVWPIIQYFKGWNYKRFPEENEIRAMSFASIVHGATGITWYTYGGYVIPEKNMYNYGITSTPERWRIITTITRQLHELEPVLVERKPADQPTPVVYSGAKLDAFGQPSITCLLKHHEGETYVLAVNSTLDTIEAGIPVAGVSGGSVMFEGRAATIVGGVLKDTFKPYDVHVYRLK